MKKPRWIVPLLAFSFIATFSACVNINVNIPEGVVQEASDDYVGQLYRAKESGKDKKKDTPAASPVASPAGTPHSSLDLLNQLAVTSAFAEYKPIRTDSDKASAIHERQKARLGDIHTQKAAGILGETNDGTLVIKGKVKPDAEAKLTKLVADENADREELYAEVVAHNSLKKGHLIDIKQSFARSFQKYSAPKTWIQDPAGNWSQKK